MANFKFSQPVMGRRTFIGGALATGAVAALAGCGGGENGAVAATLSGKKVMNFLPLRARVHRSVITLGRTQGTAVVFSVFDGLMEWDWDSASAVPCCAAEAPTISEDGRVYTFKLREGMKFPQRRPCRRRVLHPRLEARRLSQDGYSLRHLLPPRPGCRLRRVQRR
ncbi:MAG: hypothetical protein ACLTSX_08245 [Collinsella sp.]